MHPDLSQCSVAVSPLTDLRCFVFPPLMMAGLCRSIDVSDYTCRDDPIPRGAVEEFTICCVRKMHSHLERGFLDIDSDVATGMMTLIFMALEH